jgi:hypothetical protein
MQDQIVQIIIAQALTQVPPANFTSRTQLPDVVLGLKQARFPVLEVVLITNANSVFTCKVAPRR